MKGGAPTRGGGPGNNIERNGSSTTTIVRNGGSGVGGIGMMEKNVPFQNYVQSGGGEQNYHWGRIILLHWRVSQHSGVPRRVRRNWKDRRWRWK